MKKQKKRIKLGGGGKRLRLFVVGKKRIGGRGGEYYQGLRITILY